MKWAPAVVFALAVLVTAAVVFIRYDQTVSCHDRVRKSDPCWKDLNTKVSDLELRVQKLETKGP